MGKIDTFFRLYNVDASLEHRIFSVSLFIGTFFSLLLAINSILNASPLLIISINSSAAVILFFLHRISLSEQNNVKVRYIFFPLVSVAIAVAWMGNIGYLSSNNAVFLILYITLLSVIPFNNKAFIGAYAYYLCFVISLFAYDYWFMVHPHLDPEFYHRDIRIKSVVWVLIGLGVTFLIRAFRAAYISERMNLQIANEKLQELSDALQASNEELQTQGEELTMQRDQLNESNQIIEAQKIMLEERNSSLETLVNERTASLTATNIELSKQNRKLEEFSFVLAHKLKGPLATMKGLHLLEQMNGVEKDKLFHLIKEQTNQLNGIIEDLNHIMELREDRFTAPTWVNFSEVFSEEIKRLLSHFKLYDVKIHSQLNIKDVYLKRPHLVDLIGEVLLNAFQFRDNSRALEISIATYQKGQSLNVLIMDNGRGFDAAKMEEKLFQLYQVFDLEKGGRGLGLYIAKMETGFLGGNMIISSMPNIGTAVRIQLPLSNVKIKTEKEQVETEI